MQHLSLKTGFKFDTAGVEPDTAGAEPDTAGVEPDAAGLESDMTGVEPDIAGLEPAIAMFVDGHCSAHSPHPSHPSETTIFLPHDLPDRQSNLPIHAKNLSTKNVGIRFLAPPVISSAMAPAFSGKTFSSIIARGSGVATTRFDGITIDSSKKTSQPFRLNALTALTLPALFGQISPPPETDITAAGVPSAQPVPSIHSMTGPGAVKPYTGKSRMSASKVPAHARSGPAVILSTAASQPRDLSALANASAASAVHPVPEK